MAPAGRLRTNGAVRAHVVQPRRKRSRVYGVCGRKCRVRRPWPLKVWGGGSGAAVRCPGAYRAMFAGPGAVRDGRAGCGTAGAGRRGRHRLGVSAGGACSRGAGTTQAVAASACVARPGLAAGARRRVSRARDTNTGLFRGVQSNSRRRPGMVGARAAACHARPTAGGTLCRRPRWAAGSSPRRDSPGGATRAWTRARSCSAGVAAARARVGARAQPWRVRTYFKCGARGAAFGEWCLGEQRGPGWALASHKSRVARPGGAAALAAARRGRRGLKSSRFFPRV